MSRRRANVKSFINPVGSSMGKRSQKAAGGGWARPRRVRTRCHTPSPKQAGSSYQNPRSPGEAVFHRVLIAFLIFQQVIHQESTRRIPEDRKISISCLPVSYRSVSKSFRSLARLCVGLREPCYYSQIRLTCFVQLRMDRTGAEDSGKSGKKTPEEVWKQQE